MFRCDRGSEKRGLMLKTILTWLISGILLILVPIVCYFAVGHVVAFHVDILNNQDTISASTRLFSLGIFGIILVFWVISTLYVIISKKLIRKQKNIVMTNSQAVIFIAIPAVIFALTVLFSDVYIKQYAKFNDYSLCNTGTSNNVRFGTIKYYFQNDCSNYESAEK